MLWLSSSKTQYIDIKSDYYTRYCISTSVMVGDTMHKAVIFVLLGVALRHRLLSFGGNGRGFFIIASQYLKKQTTDLCIAKQFFIFPFQDLAHLLRGVHAATFKPKLGNGINTVSEKDGFIISSSSADAQFEICLE